MPLTAVPAALVPEGQNKIIGDVEMLAGARIARLAGVSAGLLNNLPPDVFLGNLYTSPAPARDFAAVDIAGIGISYDTAIGNGPFPSVVFRGTVLNAASATSHNVPIPTTQVGDRVTIAIWVNQVAQVVTTPTGFTLLGKVETTDGEADVYERIFTGSGDPVTPAVFALSVTSSLLARVWNTRYSDASKPSEIQSQLQNSAAGTTNDLPNLTQTWGSANTLYLFFIGIEVDIGPPNITAFPAGLTNTGQDQHVSGTAAIDGAMGYGEILSRANSMDLPACTYGPGRSGAFIIAIPPRPSGALNWEGLQVTGGNATTGRLTQVSFANSNGISFGLSGSTLTASVGAGGAAGSIAVPGSTLGLGLVVFTNLNGVSFGLNGSTMSASVTVPATREMGLITVNGTSVGSASRLAFANNATVTWGMTTAAGAATVGMVSIAGFTAIAGGTRTCLGPIIVLSDSNNVSFGISAVAGNSIMTASASFPAQTQFVLSNSNGITFGTNVSTVTAQFSSLSFGNANNVTFGLAGSTLTASVTVASTADPQIGLVFHIGGNSQSSVTRLAFSNASNVTWSLSTAANAVTVIASVAAGGGGGITNVNLSAGTTSQNLSAFVFSNSNNMSFGLNGSTVTGQPFFNVTGANGSSVNATVLAFTTGVNNVGFAVSTNASGATVRAAASISFSAGTTNNAVSNISFDDAGGVSFGLNGSTITASSPNDRIGAVSVVGGATSGVSITRLAFSNQANVTLALITAANQATIRFSVNEGIGLLSHVGGNSVGTATRFAFSDLNGISFGLSTAAGAGTLTASYDGVRRVFAGTTSNSLSALSFSNINGISFGLSTAGGGMIITGSVGGLAISASTQLATSGTVLLSNHTALDGAFEQSYLSNNVVFGMSGSSAVTGKAFINFSALGSQIAATRIQFSNANGVSFGFSSTSDSLDGGRWAILTASVAGGGGGGGVNIAASGITQTSGVVAFTNVAGLAGAAGSANTNNVFFSLNSAAVGSLAGTALFGIEAGNVGTTFNPVFVTGFKFINSNGITFGTQSTSLAQGKVILITAQSSQPSIFAWKNFQANGLDADGFKSMVPASNLAGCFPLQPYGGPFPGNMNLSDLNYAFYVALGTSASQSVTVTLRGGLYTLNNSTQLSLLNSFSLTVGSANTASSALRTGWAGARYLRISVSNWSSAPTLAYGSEYWMVHYINTVGNVSTCRWMGAAINPYQQFSGFVGVNATTEGLIGGFPFHGVLSTTGIPATVGTGNFLIGTVASSATAYYAAVPALVARDGVVN